MTTHESLLPELTITTLAQGLHGAYAGHRVSDGETAEENPSIAEWERLPEYMQESNREAVREFLRRLQAMGYRVVAAAEPTPVVPASELDKSRDFLAQVAHIHWVNTRRALGWRVAPPPKDPENLTHPSLVPWAELSAAEQAKDHEQIADLFRLLEERGWKLARGTDLKELPTAEIGELGIERLAEVMHEDTVSRRMGEEVLVLEDETLRRWEHLAEERREAIRQTVRNLIARLDAMGYQAGLDTEHNDPNRVTLEDFHAQVEPLARMAHTRWRNERMRQGWNAGAYDPVKRTHPSVASWEELPAEDRTRAMSRIRELPVLLAKAGLQLRRKRPVASPGAAKTAGKPGLLGKLVGRRE